MRRTIRVGIPGGSSVGDQLVDHAVGQPLGAGLRYPEQATLLRAERNGTIAALVVEYGTSDAVGRVRVRVQATPKVVIEDEGEFSQS
ncbi:hypothetical protein [Paractinoplanes hotanensis]|uniref:Uncharacterized protein n=1 Tax=Paractinoplanes hotanensis TaxID=2906497 RepID=A0ABT0YGF5_9ACTN|nr:hypothetical protein [Actinoplanes hotanensis]MCM4085149.1 hypothetical protein [Actinoplanes hotanensis]